MMENEFVTYEQALALKELGFDEPCLLIIQYASDYDIFTGSKFQNSIWLGNGYEANIDDKKIKYKFPKDSGVNYGRLKIPLKQQVFRWFREKYSLEIILCPDCFNEPSKLLREYKIISIDKSIILDQCTDQKHWIRKGCFVSYEEAESAAIDKLIEIVKQK